MTARVSEIRIDGMRCFSGFAQSTSGLVVLIGENGVGKSTIVEACELLRKTTETQFLTAVGGVHGGVRALLRHGANRLTLGVSIDGLLGSSTARYDITLAREGGRLVIADEQLVLDGSVVGTRSSTVSFLDLKEGPSRQQPPNPESTFFSFVWHLPEGHPLRAIHEALVGIEVFPPLPVTARWVSEGGPASLVRLEQNPSIERRVGRFGLNLPGALLELRNDPTRWDAYLMLVRAGLGEDVENIVISPADTPLLTFGLKFRGDPVAVTSESLSDGTVALLAILAILELRPPTRSLLVFDEPELHLHPSVVALLADRFQAAGADQSVLVTTHSDRFLDALREPHRSAVVLERTASGSRQAHLDPASLTTWLRRYAGLGELRNAGHLDDVKVAS
jgi:predicted ATPase